MCGKRNVVRLEIRVPRERQTWEGARLKVETYLKRINYNGPLDPDLETLRRLHMAHLLQVPFENFDIHLGRPIVLEDAALFNKIVEQRRGGFCYELNGLFCWLLKELGYRVEKLSAGVARKEGGFDPDFDHMALLVQLEQRWLADVGFGDSFREPLRLDELGEQHEEFGAYRLDREGDRLILMQRCEDGSWEPQYRFTLSPYEYTDYVEMCRFHQTSPKSPFTRGRVCTLARPDGRITLREMRLITTLRGEKRERMLEGEEERDSVLRDLFGIELGTDGR
jgi:N-hydroxyarylamine O-acetyltransferase